MNKITVGLVAGCLSAFVGVAYAASGSPASSDAAGRQPYGTAASQSGATEATPRAAPGGGGLGSSSSTGSSASATAGTGGNTGTGMSGSNMDGANKGTRARRASRG